MQESRRRHYRLNTEGVCKCLEERRRTEESWAGTETRCWRSRGGPLGLLLVAPEQLPAALGRLQLLVALLLQSAAKQRARQVKRAWAWAWAAPAELL